MSNSGADMGALAAPGCRAAASMLRKMASVDAYLMRQRWLALATVSLALLFFWALHITPTRVENDAAETLRMAVNLQHEGVASNDSEAPYRPSMTREPMPVIVNALLIGIMDAIVKPASAESYFFGLHASLLKYQNLVWLGLLFGVIFTAIRFFTASPAAGLAGVLIGNLPLLDGTNSRYMIDSLYTESPAAALLALGTLLLVLGIHRRDGPLTAAAGLAFGLLALVKAVFLYVFAGLVLLLAVVWVGIRLKQGRGQNAFAGWHLALLTVMFAAVVTPWTYRNHVELGTFAITERSGEVLYVRALKDRMSMEEARGTFYVWAPWPVDAVVRRILGFSRQDLARGGRLQHINRWEGSEFAADDMRAEKAGKPGEAIAYYRQSRAEFNRILMDLRASGHPHPVLEANRIQKDRAIEMILERPLEHLGMSVAFLWRGAFFTFPVFLLALVWTVARRDWLLGLVAIPALGLIMFYGLFSHFIARYGLPAYPIAIILGVVIIVRLASPRGAGG